jgi:hypothetical protein
MEYKMFLDLEQTIIDNWQDAYLYLPFRVRAWLDRMLNEQTAFNLRPVGIFSFAIYNDKDKATFEDEMKHALELGLSIKITEWPSVEEMARTSQLYTGTKWCGGKEMSTLDLIDFIQIRGKVGAFEDWCMAQPGNDITYILLDDVVPNKTVIDHKRNIKIEYINVDNMRML